MIKTYKIILRACIIFICVITASTLNAAVDLPWSTTYDCLEWDQSQGSPSCDGLALGGGWTCEGLGEQITSDANYPNGAGGKGQRHWKGDGIDNPNSGGLSLSFNTPQKELWIRWYMRYEEGFKWSYLNYDKWLYIHTNVKGCDVIPEFCWSNGIVVGVQGGGDAYQIYNDSRGWQYVYGTESDGSWFCVEIHIKMDTNGSDGVGELWLDGKLVASNYAVNYSSNNSTAQQGWTWFLVGSNQKSANNGRPMYVDFDDFYVTNTRPSNKDANGNYFIGPLDSDSFPPVSPPPLSIPPNPPTGVKAQVAQ